MDKIFKKIFMGQNGQCYYVLFGKKGEPALLLNTDIEQYVVCRILEDNSWWHGEYFCDFDKAYEFYKNNFKKE